MAVLERLIWQIETDLKSDSRCRPLSRRCAVNLHHMCRVFQLATGMSIMAYARARRLSLAARAIACGQESIIAIALDAGYGFPRGLHTRLRQLFRHRAKQAERRAVHHNPHLMEPFEMNKDMIVPLAAPRREDRAPSALSVLARLRLRQDGEIRHSGDPSWPRRRGAKRCARAGLTASAAWPMAPATSATLPYRGDRLDTRNGAYRHPGQTYAVFTHSGHISVSARRLYDLEQGTAGRRTESANAPDFERYDHRFDGRTVAARWRSGFRSFREGL